MEPFFSRVSQHFHRTLNLNSTPPSCLACLPARCFGGGRIILPLVFFIVFAMADVELLLTPPLANDDLSLPKATVQKIVSEILPSSTGIAFSKEARDVLIECCVEFITLVSSEANEISEKEAKKTIACDHITKALETLGFPDYVPAVLEAAAEHKEVQKARPVHFHLTSWNLLTPNQGREKKANKFEQSGMTLEELERLQAEQFAAAAARHT